MSFQDNLAAMPDIGHLSGLDILDAQGKAVHHIPNAPGKQGSLKLYNALAYAFLNQFDHVLPIWGVQRKSELEEFISYQTNSPELSSSSWRKIEKDRMELAHDFCRGCGYCMPCPAGIQICDCARMSLFLRRAPLSMYLTEEWAEKMKKIEDCKHCNACREKCPYSLDTPTLLQSNYEDFKVFWAKR